MPNLPKQLLALALFLFCGHLSVSAAQAAARFELSPTSGTIQTSGTSVTVTVNADGNQLKSASAVITFDAAKVTVTSANGTYFPTVNTDTTKTGEIVISGTLTIGDTVGVTGTGTLATLTIKPVSGATGSAAVAFRCSDTSSDDSNIITMVGANLLATTTQCSANVGGSYTFAATGGSSSTTTNVQCNLDCSDTATCASGLSCVSGKCRNPSCNTTTNCTCSGAAIAGAQGSSTLPASGSVGQTAFLIGSGVLFLISSVFLLNYAKRFSGQEEVVETDESS
ncbi:MAG: hypothetical protein O2840_02735 [bacterium]|nr:hypothetical protein [bacterium]